MLRTPCVERLVGDTGLTELHLLKGIERENFDKTEKTVREIMHLKECDGEALQENSLEDYVNRIRLAKNVPSIDLSKALDKFASEKIKKKASPFRILNKTQSVEINFA